ncbi:MAG: hypothetical protein J6X55_11865, partial [Victivallales bacterium]|nr:hypothetical protein [Victivallales bacterium]
FGNVFPLASIGNEGLSFIFGRSDDDYGTYVAKTSLQHALLKCLKEQGRLRRAGWFIVPELID